MKHGIWIFVSPLLLVGIVMGLLGGVAAGENGRPSQHAPASRPETQPATSPAEAPLQVVAFYSSTCYNCEKMRKTLKACQDRWPKRIRVEHRDIKDLTLFVQLIAYNKHYHAKAQAPPKVFVGEQYLEDYPAIFKRLQTVVPTENLIWVESDELWWWVSWMQGSLPEGYGQFGQANGFWLGRFFISAQTDSAIFEVNA